MKCNKLSYIWINKDTQLNSLYNVKRTNKFIINDVINDIIYAYEMICKRKTKEKKKKGKKRFAHAQAVAKTHAEIDV